MCRSAQVALALLLSLASVPAAADWLKTVDGALIETQGPWTVRRNVVVFKLPNGTLASLRLQEVDLEGSRAATEEAVSKEAVSKETVTEEAARTPAGAEGEAVVSVTMKDISEAVPEAVAKPEEKAEPARYEPVQVAAWSPAETTDIDGTEIRGTLLNGGPRIVMGIRLDAKLLDEDGKVLATVRAFLGEDSLAPTMTTHFRALFPGIYTYAKPYFEIHSTEIQIESAAPPRTGR